MWPFIPKYKSKDPKKRLQGLYKLNPNNHSHHRIIAEISQNDESLEVRLAAIEKLTDQNLLMDITKHDKVLVARQLAYKVLGKENSQESIFDIARNDKNWINRKNAVDKLSEQAFLVDIAKDEEKLEIRQAAITKLKDQSLLFEIAKNDKSLEIRRTAIKMLSNQNIILSFAKNDNDFEIRQFAFKILSLENSQEAVVDRITNIKDCALRKTFVEKLTDQNILTYFAQNDDFIEVRQAAVRNLTDHIILAGIALNDKVCEVRQSAFKILGKENSFEAIYDNAKNAKDWFIRKSALEKLADTSLLEDIAKNDQNWIVRLTAVKKLTNQNHLIDFAINDEEFEVRQFAYKIMGKEDSREALLDVAQNDLNNILRESALIKLLEKEEDDYKSRVLSYFKNNLSLTNLWHTKLFSHYYPDEINELILSSVASALIDEIFITDKKRKFQLSDEIFSNILKFLSDHGNISVLAALTEKFVHDYSFSYTIDRYTSSPHDCEEKRKCEIFYWRTTQVFECISNILSGLKIKPGSLTFETLNAHYKVNLIKKEVTYIGDDSHDQTYVDEVYYSSFQKYIKVN
jgi:hypothetical protein